MEELCESVSKSESQAIRVFKNSYKVTPYSYLLDKRIDLSKQLLKNTNFSVKQIAYSLCFSDEFYFSNIFKKKVGISPSEFRKRE
ncbi:MAG: helix-turn-helix transcriptional regulator [Clostridia bacterium]|nr:helix-turn-helix transcriptional regulator [Clostridia bacterium]